MVLDVAKGSCICVFGFMFDKFGVFLGGKQFLPSLHTLAYSISTQPALFSAQEMQAVPTNMSAMSTIRMLRANTGGDNAQPPLPPEPSYAPGIGGVDGVSRKVWIETCLK